MILRKVHPRSIGIGISGLGLILLGIALAFYLPFVQRSGIPRSSPADISVLPVRVQFEAPALSLLDLQGRPHALADYRGKVVLVNLWATWCPPCKAEMPAIQTFYVKHQHQGFAVVAIEDGDPQSDVVAFVRQFGLTFTILPDPTYQATEHAFKTTSLPSSYLIDRNGTVRLEWVGAINEPNLEKYVTPIIEE